MVLTRSSGGKVSPAVAIMTNRRSIVLADVGGAFGATTTELAAGSGGSSEGHRKARSTRSWEPARRCTGTRMAAGGTLKAVPAMVIGSEGASGAGAGPGQLGHST